MNLNFPWSSLTFFKKNLLMLHLLLSFISSQSSSLLHLLRSPPHPPYLKVSIACPQSGSCLAQLTAFDTVSTLCLSGICVQYASDTRKRPSPTLSELHRIPQREKKNGEISLISHKPTITTTQKPIDNLGHFVFFFKYCHNVLFLFE